MAKRALSEQARELQNDIFHIEATLNVLGYIPGARKNKRIFRNGELIALVGEAERRGIVKGSASRYLPVDEQGVE